MLTVRQANYIIPKYGSTHNYLTRQQNQLAAPKFNLNYFYTLLKSFLCKNRYCYLNCFYFKLVLLFSCISDLTPLHVSICLETKQVVNKVCIELNR